MKSADIAQLLEGLARALRKGDDSKLKRALEALVGDERPEKRSSKRPASGKIDRRYLDEIKSALLSASSREEGAKLLFEAELTRMELVELARSVSVHITKADNIPRIEEKLVEGVIGSRLSSAAIRGER